MAARLRLGARWHQAAVMSFLTVSLAGCSVMGDVSSTDTDIVKIGTLLLHSITGIGSASEVPRERVAAIPYASLGVRLGSSDQSLLVLASKNGDNLLWVGGRSIALTVRAGRIVRTVGFAQNLSGIETTSGPASGESDHPNYLYDFAEQSRFGVAVKCSRTDLGHERVVILGVSHDTDHVAEDCEAAEMDWNFRNEYWSDPSGFVWKSRQNVAPDLDAFDLEVLRPAE